MHRIKIRSLMIGVIALLGAYSMAFPAARAIAVPAISTPKPAGLSRQEQIFRFSVIMLAHTISGFIVELLKKRSVSRLPDASPFYRKHFNEACRAYGIRNPEKMLLKNDSTMEALGEASFLAVKINEKISKEVSIAQRIHTCWHEAAHGALGHTNSFKLLIPLGFCTAYMGHNLGHFLDSKSINTSKFNLFLTLLFCHCFKRCLKFVKGMTGPWLKMPDEKEADAMAIEYLIKAGKRSIVDEIHDEYKENCASEKDFKNCSQKLEEFTRWGTLRDQAHAKIEAKQARVRALYGCIERAS